jgi:S-methylmethionine-dependent homocysteine/selenocysteine methylase
MGLPQLADTTFITDGGMETTLIFHQGLELPHFASFVLLDDEKGVRALREYFRPYVDGDPIDLARRYAELRQRLPNLTIVGGCCGTDHRHIREICRVWSS